MKKELQATIMAFRSSMEAAIEEIRNVKSSGHYTPVGLQQKVEEVNENFAKYAEAYKTKAVAMIEQAEEKFKSTCQKNTAGYLTDPGHQAGLSNVFQLLEFGDVSEADFKGIVKAFENDSLALKAIKGKVIALRMPMEFLSYLPVTNDVVLDGFALLKKNVIGSSHVLPAGNSIAAQSHLSMALKTLDRMDDQLILIEMGGIER